MHISEVRKVIAYAPPLNPGRGLGGSDRHGQDLSLRLLQRLALRQQHHELKFWGDKDSEAELLQAPSLQAPQSWLSGLSSCRLWTACSAPSSG